MISDTFTYHPMVGDAERIDRLYNAVDNCDVGFGLAKQVYYLGRPAFTARDSECPTSCVITRPGGSVIFQFNRQFFDELGSEEVAFVTLHEALHIAFRHAERRGERDPGLWNVACDVVINELLLAQPHFLGVQTESFKKLIDGAATYSKFATVLGSLRSMTALSAESIYEQFIRHPGLRRAVRKLMQALRPFHVNFGANGPTAARGPSAWEREQLARRLDGILDGQRFAGWSLVESGELRQVRAARGATVPWDKLLLSRVNTALRERSTDSWTPSRRLAGLYPSILLPSERPREEKGMLNLLLAIDCSGSITPALLARLLGVTRTIPRDRVAVEAISFDVNAYPFDLDDPHSTPRGGGGTSFECIEQFASSQEKYPDLIAVLTDGAGNPPTTTNGSRWLWLITPDGTETYVQGIGAIAHITV